MASIARSTGCAGRGGRIACGADIPAHGVPRGARAGQGVDAVFSGGPPWVDPPARAFGATRAPNR